MAVSALLVSIPEAEGIVGRWRSSYDPSASRGLPAHVTVLYPFVEPAAIDEALRSSLRGLFESLAPFRVVFDHLGRFPGPVLYLAPLDPEPFVNLTSTVQRAFPAHPPYEGRYSEVVAHLTVVDGADEATVDAVSRALTPSLPVPARVDEVVLMAGDSSARSWRVLEVFALGRRSETPVNDR